MSIRIERLQNARERERLYQFLYEIWADEFCRSMEGMDHERRRMQDELDATAHHLIAVDRSGRIVGCVRANSLKNSLLPETVRRSLRVEELVELFGGEGVWYGSHFAVAPEARGRTVASLLIAALYQQCLEAGALVGVSYCALPYLSFYFQLGYRPYTENFRIDAGVRVPIVHCLRDRRYLEKIKSPLLRLCPAARADGGGVGGKLSKRFPLFREPGFYRVQVHHLWARLAHTTPGESNGRGKAFLAGLSDDEQRVLNRRLSEISFRQGEYVYRSGEREDGMGVLISGTLGVEVPVGGTPRIVNILLPGEPFGEVHSLGAQLRTADLVALEDAQAFFFPSDFLERAGRADTGLGFKLAMRLLNILALRFVNLSSVVVDDGHAVASAPIHRPAPLPEKKKGGRIESYRFESLGDREGEFTRLMAQATIGEDIEFALLERMGLRDGMTVLDLGSGPGATSLLFARRLPAATVIGVEPEDLLRVKAQTLVADQGLGSRCRFLQGTGDRIPLQDEQVDFSYARLLFQHLSDPLAVLQELRRVTRRGGRIVLLDVDDRTNIIHPAPPGLDDLERRIVAAQAAAGGDRHVGRKLQRYMHECGLQEIGVEPVPITAAALGREAFFTIVYSFKRQVLARTGGLDQPTAETFRMVEEYIRNPETFAMTTVFVAHGVVA